MTTTIKLFSYRVWLFAFTLALLASSCPVKAVHGTGRPSAWF